MQAPTLNLAVRPSRLLRYGVIALHVLAVIAVMLADVPWAWRLALLLAVALGLALQLRTQPVRALRCEANGDLLLESGGEWMPARVLPSTLVAPQLIVLHTRFGVEPQQVFKSSTAPEEPRTSPSGRAGQGERTGGTLFHPPGWLIALSVRTSRLILGPWLQRRREPGETDAPDGCNRKFLLRRFAGFLGKRGFSEAPISGQRLPGSLVILPDSLSADDFRRLRIWLRWRSRAADAKD
jgi:hypothetical protein